MSRPGFRRVASALLLLVSFLGAARLPGQAAPSEADRSRAVQLHRQAIERLREGLRASSMGDARGFAGAMGEAASHVESLLTAAAWLPSSRKDALRELATELRARVIEGPAGYAPDEHLATLDRIGQELRRTTSIELSFEGSFAESKAEEPVYGGHATAMGPPPTEAPKADEPSAGSAIRFDVVRGQLTKETFGGGPSKWHLVESGGNGVALVDYDGDGLLDIYTVSAFELDERNGRARIPHRNALYRNLGKMKFEEVGAAAGVDAAAWGYGVCAGDYDDDGRLDLYVTNYGPNLLYRNRGDGTFEETASRAGVAASGWSTGCAFLDADGDGDLDLYVSRYVEAPWEEVVSLGRFLIWRGVAKVMLGPTGLPGEADLFFENQGDGTFREVTVERGLADTTKAYGFGVVTTDFDGDGWTDIFVANDSNPDFLYKNRAGKGFDNVALLAGIAVNQDGRAQAGMGADAGDFDGDGHVDIAGAAFSYDYNSLYRNLGNGSFEDVSQASGIAAPTFDTMTWGVSFLDADLDGDVDLFFAHGHLFPQVDEHASLRESYAQKDQVFENDRGLFRDVSAAAGRGLAVQKASRAVAVGDLDNDGDPDLVVSAMDEVPTLLENTQTTGHHWLGVTVKKERPNAFAIGARVTVLDSTGRKQLREIRSGGGYLSQSDLRPLFGLGAAKGPVTIEIRLGADRWRFGDVAVDQHLTLFLDEEHRVGR